MANSTLFRSDRNGNTTKYGKVDTVNLAGGKAYSLEAEHALAQYTCTGTLHGTYYANASYHLEEAKKLLDQVSPEFALKCAIYGRQKAYMKDMPALILAYVANKMKGNRELTAQFRKAFPLVVTNGRMLRNFVQIIRSGQLGRKSLGTVPKKLIQNWLNNRKVEKLFRDSVGQNPSINDVIKLSHPKPPCKEREAFYRYLINKEADFEKLPQVVKNYELFKNGESSEVPNVEFRMLTQLPLSSENWKEIAKNMGWHALRMNLNTLVRHNALNDQETMKLVADRLRDRNAIKYANVFPYQLLAAYKNTSDVPVKVRNALQDAMEIATENVPSFDKKIIVCIDTSGSMSSPATGYRGTSTSEVRCIDVAGLITAVLVRNNEETTVIPFDTRPYYDVDINNRDSVMSIARQLGTARGGTDCSCALRHANELNLKSDLVIYVSDNMSWYISFSSLYGGHYRRTNTMAEWEKFRRRNPNAKLVNIDIQPTNDTQTPETKKEILNVGGFSDQVFDVIKDFVSEDSNWIDRIKEVEI